MAAKWHAKVEIPGKRVLLLNLEQQDQKPEVMEVTEVFKIDGTCMVMVMKSGGNGEGVDLGLRQLGLRSADQREFGQFDQYFPNMRIQFTWLITKSGVPSMCSVIGPEGDPWGYGTTFDGFEMDAGWRILAIREDC